MSGTLAAKNAMNCIFCAQGVAKRSRDQRERLVVCVGCGATVVPLISPVRAAAGGANND